MCASSYQYKHASIVFNNKSSKAVLKSIQKKEVVNKRETRDHHSSIFLAQHHLAPTQLVPVVQYTIKAKLNWGESMNAKTTMTHIRPCPSDFELRRLVSLTYGSLYPNSRIPSHANIYYRRLSRSWPESMP